MPKNPDEARLLAAPSLMPAATIVTPARDPFVDRARAVYLYVVAIIALVQGVVLPLADIFGRHVQPLPLSLLAVLVTPAVVFMFGKSAEQIIKSRIRS